MFFAIYFMICAPIRAVEILFFKFDLASLLITSIFQGPLTILILYDLVSGGVNLNYRDLKFSVWLFRRMDPRWNASPWTTSCAQKQTQ